MILDPDIYVDIWTMGLIYKIDIKSPDKVEITMTFTTPFCPSASMLKEQIREQLESIGYQTVTIIVTFTPQWKCPEDLRVMLGI